MFIFYDLETSSRELLGQILTYSFILTNNALEIVETFNGSIKLNRTQLPEIDAILTNRIKISELQKQGDSEHEAAYKIHYFLIEKIQQYGYCTLVGYNSNRFDIEFLRNLQIRYGLNPYFRGMLANLDIYHYVQYLAFYNEEHFPWVLQEGDDREYFSFKLEDITHKMGLLEGAQTHAAEDDVKLTIDLVKTLQTKFNLPLKDFRPVQLPTNTHYQDTVETGKQRIRDFRDHDEPPAHFIYAYWLKILATKNAKIVLNLEKYQQLKDQNTALDEAQLLGCLRYINHNKQFFVLEEFNESDKAYFDSICMMARDEPFFNTLTLDRYFELIDKEWDIDYQIHKLGFERIDTLKNLIDTLMESPKKYDDMLKDLLRNRKDKKDTYLIQLFNRVYLNYHPSPRPDFLQKYIEPRYISGTLYRDKDTFTPFEKSLDRLKHCLQDPAHEKDNDILQDLYAFYMEFSNKHFSKVDP